MAEPAVARDIRRCAGGEGDFRVTVLSSITGYGAHRTVHPKGLIGRPHDKPSILVVVEREHTLRRVMPTGRGMIAEGIVIMSDAEVIPLP